MTLRVSRLEASRRFYDSFFEVLEHREPPHVNEDFAEWGEFSLLPAGSRRPTRRLHVAFVASSRERVDRFWTRLTEAGYRDNGAPGERPGYHPGYYRAYVLDPDGNNVELVHHNRGA